MSERSDPPSFNNALDDSVATVQIWNGPVRLPVMAPATLVKPMARRSEMSSVGTMMRLAVKPSHRKRPNWIRPATPVLPGRPQSATHREP